MTDLLLETKCFTALALFTALADTVTDFWVLILWFLDDSIWTGYSIFLIICIFAPSVWFLMTLQWFELPDSFWHIFTYVCTILLSGGLILNLYAGCIILFKEEVDYNEAYFFAWVRTFGVLLESVPAGALQLFLILREDAETHIIEVKDHLLIYYRLVPWIFSNLCDKLHGPTNVCTFGTLQNDFF